MSKNKKILVGLLALAVLVIVGLFATGNLNQGNLNNRLSTQKEFDEETIRKAAEELNLTYPESFIALQKLNIIDYDNQDPQRRVNRAEFVTILNRSEKIFNPQDKGCFPDVKGKWYEGHVCYAYNHGILDGYPDGKFKAERKINFAEASKILTLFYDVDLGEGKNNWYQKYIEGLEKINAIPITIHNTYNIIDKEHLVEIVWRIINKNTELPSLTYEELVGQETLIKTAVELTCGPIKTYIDKYGLVKYYNQKVLKSESSSLLKSADAIAKKYGFKNAKDYQSKLDEYGASNLDPALSDEIDEKCDVDRKEYPIHF